MNILTDNYNRSFYYLRLSITDICNFNCKYCLPNFKKFDKKEYLSLSEIENLISAFVDLGVVKIRLTGGEPTVRRDFLDIGFLISKFKSIKSLVFTTNGYKLDKIANDICNVGFNGVNISLDSLDKDKFFLITNKNYFNNVLNGIFLLLDLNLDVKLNVVLSDFFSFLDFENFYSLLKYKRITIRFIDQMETIDIKKQSNNVINSIYISSFLERNGWHRIYKDSKISGPASLFVKDGFLGSIGIINPYSNSFCQECNRLRISSVGDLFLCLFGGTSYSVREFLDSSKKKNDLIKFLLDKVKLKSKSHFLHDKKFGVLKTFSSIGG